MKKNMMMRIASVLLVAVLLSTCAISGTFAKYVSKATASDTARVAYWGFGNDTSTTFALFDHGDSDVKADVIAPGTSGSATLKLEYAANGSIAAPEVAYTYSVAVEVTGDTTVFDENQNFVWTFNGNEYQTIDQFKTAVTKTENVAAGALPTVQSYTIGWEWKFVDATTYDNDMGNAADLADIAVTLTITATQVNID